MKALTVLFIILSGGIFIGCQENKKSDEKSLSAIISTTDPLPDLVGDTDPIPEPDTDVETDPDTGGPTDPTPPPSVSRFEVKNDPLEIWSVLAQRYLHCTYAWMRGNRWSDRVCFYYRGVLTGPSNSRLLKVQNRDSQLEVQWQVALDSTQALITKDILRIADSPWVYTTSEATTTLSSQTPRPNLRVLIPLHFVGLPEASGQEAYFWIQRKRMLLAYSQELRKVYIIEYRFE